MNKGRFLLLVLGIVFKLAGFAQQASCDVSVSGVVLDIDTKEPIPFASVKLENLPKGAVSDVEGKFNIEGLCEQEFELVISCVGYKTTKHHHDAYHPSPVIYLAEDDKVLESVVVEAVKDSPLHSIASLELDSRDLEMSRTSNFADAASQIAGVTMLSTGQNISTPVIHGLHGSRILIINDDIRHEYQSWGSDHAPEIDMSQVDHLEVVKGAATVRYGPDALGGVLLVYPRKLELSQPLKGSLGFTGKSNGYLGNSSLFLSRGWSHMAFEVEGDFTKQGDLKSPGYYLTNTGKEEYHYGAGIRWHKNRFDLEGKYSRFNQKLGVLRWSVNGNLDDLVRSMENEPSDTTDFSYDIKQPFQKVDHQVFLLKSSLQFGNQELKVRYAYQANHRQEFGLRTGTKDLIPTIDLDLRVSSLDVDWIHPQFGEVQGRIGLQWQYHDNNNIPGTNTAQFVPNYNYQRLGLYMIENLELASWDLEFGLRYDYHYMSARGIYQYQRYSQDLTYNNVTSSIGLVKEIDSHQTFRLNIGNAWRPPNMAELYSFGRHESLYQYGYWTYQYDDQNELTTPTTILSNKEKPVNSEMGYKMIANYQYQKRGWNLNTSAYINYIKNYFYARPAGITRNTQGAFPYYIYDQNDALLIGGDAQAVWKHHVHYQSTFTTNYVWSRNISNHDYFVGTPPLDLSYKLEYTTKNDYFNDLTVGIIGKYAFKQWFAPRVIRPSEIIEAYENDEDLFAEDDSSFDFMAATDGYFLLDLNVSVQKGHFNGQFQVQNLLNTKYRSYTDVMRYYTNQAGINFVFTVKYNL